MLRAVIFDMDGVLIDSYRAHFESFRAVAADEGVFFDEPAFAPTFGRTSRDIIGALWGEKCPDEAGIAALDDRKEAAFRDLVARDPPVMDGARELLAALRAAGLPLAIGSSGPRENVELAIRGLGAEDAFAAVVTGHDVEHGKPDPEVFLLAAERLGVPAGGCVVVEDAPAGVRAARAAGMAAVALLSTGWRRQDHLEAPPDLVVRSLRELDPERLRGLRARGRDL